MSSSRHTACDLLEEGILPMSLGMHTGDYGGKKGTGQPGYWGYPVFGLEPECLKGHNRCPQRLWRGDMAHIGPVSGLPLEIQWRAPDNVTLIAAKMLGYKPFQPVGVGVPQEGQPGD